MACDSWDSAYSGWNYNLVARYFPVSFLVMTLTLCTSSLNLSRWFLSLILPWLSKWNSQDRKWANRRIKIILTHALAAVNLVVYSAFSPFLPLLFTFPIPSDTHRGLVGVESVLECFGDVCQDVYTLLQLWRVFLKKKILVSYLSCMSNCCLTQNADLSASRVHVP